MSAFVLDASVTIAWLFRDEAHPYANAVMDLANRMDVHAPGVWPLEVANVLLTSERKKRISVEDSQEFAELLSRMWIRISPDDAQHVMTKVMGMAKTTGLTAYDASYLELAKRLGCPLATLDSRLRTAAEQMGIPLLTVD